MWPRNQGSPSVPALLVAPHRTPKNTLVIFLGAVSTQITPNNQQRSPFVGWVIILVVPWKPVETSMTFKMKMESQKLRYPAVREAGWCPLKNLTIPSTTPSGHGGCQVLVFTKAGGGAVGDVVAALFGLKTPHNVQLCTSRIKCYYFDQSPPWQLFRHSFWRTAWCWMSYY